MLRMTIVRGNFTLLAVKEPSSPGRSGIPEAQRMDRAKNGNKHLIALLASRFKKLYVSFAMT